MNNAIKALLALLAVIITMGALWVTNRVVPPKESTWDDVRAEARQGGYRVITTDELSRKYTAEPESLLLVDTRQEWEYRTGHIKKGREFSHGADLAIALAQ